MRFNSLLVASFANMRKEGDICFMLIAVPLDASILLPLGQIQSKSSIHDFFPRPNSVKNAVLL